MSIHEAISQCLREIARCEEYLRSGESEEMAGALQGLQDWTVELALLADVNIG